MCIPAARTWYIVIIIELINSHSVDADPLPCPDPCSGVVGVSLYYFCDTPKAVLMWNCIARIAFACSLRVFLGNP